MQQASKQWNSLSLVLLIDEPIELLVRRHIKWDVISLISLQMMPAKHDTPSVRGLRLI